MRWGVRNETKKSNSKRNKRIKIVLGSVAVAGAITAGTIYVKRHFGVKVSDILEAPKQVTNFSKGLADEPIGIMHSSRGRNRGYAFLQGGGVKGNLHDEFIKAGLDKAEDGYFKRYGLNGEKIAARYLDPEGRKDFSGRPIAHDVILPASMTKNANTLDGVIRKSWPKIKPLFDAFYESEAATFGPGY